MNFIHSVPYTSCTVFIFITILLTVECFYDTGLISTCNIPYRKNFLSMKIHISENALFNDDMQRPITFSAPSISYSDRSIILKNTIIFLSFSLLLPKKSYSSIIAKDEMIKTPLHSDEYFVIFPDVSLGLGLIEDNYKGFPITLVKSIKNLNLIKYYPDLRVGSIIVQVGDSAVDGLPLNRVAKLINELPRPLQVKFRDPNRYFELLDSADQDLRLFPDGQLLPPPPDNKDFFAPISSEYLPANTKGNGRRAEVIEVQRMSLPAYGKRGKSSHLLDVMELRYTARVAVPVGLESGIGQMVGVGDAVDSSDRHSPPGSSSGTIYLVLGQRNAATGPVPPGWDLTLQGMVIGEKRRVILPPSLAFGFRGYRNEDGKLVIPSDSFVEYVVELVSLT